MFSDLFKPAHIIILLIVCFLIFGAKKLPEAARSIAKAFKIFKSEISNKDTIDAEVVEEKDK